MMGQGASSGEALDLIASFGQVDMSEFELSGGETQDGALAAFTKEQLQNASMFFEQRMKDLQKNIRKLSANQNAGFITQFRGITAGSRNPATASKLQHNAHMNRYHNIVAYDFNRVLVKPCKANHNCDYINASWINGQAREKQYIATQGPVPHSFYSFWQMVWDENVKVIVMVTNEVEKDRLKCHRYWPAEEGTIQFGNVFVTPRGSEVHPTFVKRTFEVKAGAEVREVMQVQYTAWPDHGVPATTKEMINFRNFVKGLQGAHPGPLLTHCSAGVGRTGTFLGLDRFLDACVALDTVTILSIVEDMRNSRNFMVQSQIQFMYLHLVCLEGLQQMYTAVNKALQRMEMSQAQREEEEIKEVAEALEQQQDAFDTIKRRKKARVVSAMDVFEDTSLEAAKAVSASARLSSLEQTAAKDWKETASIPLTAKDKGYEQESAPALEHRLSALANSQLAWLAKYEDLKDQWAIQHDDGGETYNIHETLAPLDSRIQSLANANAAYSFRTSAEKDAQEAALQASMASLQTRLQSLSGVVHSSEERWKQRGHQFGSAEVADDAPRQHTTEMLGTLMDRLALLQEEQGAWFDRANPAVERYDTEKFDKDIEAERAAQEEKHRLRIAREEAKMAEIAKAKEAAEAKARQEREKLEAEERERLAKIDRKAVFSQKDKVDVTDPKVARKLKAEKEAEEQRRIKEEAEAQKKLEAEALAREQAKAETKNKASKKALKFLKGLSKK
eukprot:m.309989 g.309989  ORF g.309989 m.309989 type:complete len:732 (+) comp15947_c0_seq2:264-2459(+)